MTPEELAAAEATTVLMPAVRPSWWERAVAAFPGALAVTGCAPAAWWLAGETAARR